jgi:hypothetical protein
MADTKTKPEDEQPKNSSQTEESLPTEKLDKVSGGRRGGDPCEGGEVTLK